MTIVTPSIRQLASPRLPTTLKRCGHVAFPIIPRRDASTSASSDSEVLELAFEKAEPPSGSSSSSNSPPVVVLHGLFGQKQNWRSLGRAMAKSMNTHVYALDLRNHGTSPHHPTMTYEVMAKDVRHFFDTHGLTNVALIGHSMGGKVASALALDPQLPENTLSSLVIADVSPFKFSISKEFQQYLDAMKAIDNARVPDSKTAMKILAERDLPIDIQHFLLTNLGGAPNGEHGRKFRIPLDVLDKNLVNVGDFPYEPGQAKYKGRTLVVRGAKSNYVTDKRLNKMHEFFPNLQAETLDTGHWLHAEKPHEFLSIVKRFILPE